MDRRAFLGTAAAASLGLAVVKPVSARPTGGTPLALVTADDEAHIVAVELFGGHVIRRLQTLRGPRSIQSLSGTTAVVAHTAEGAVSLLDNTPLRVRDVVDGFEAPRYSALTPFDRIAYVTDSERGELVTLDAARGRIVQRIRLAGPARHVTFSPVRKTLWVALGSRARELAIVDASRPMRPRLVARVRPPFLAHDVGYSHDERHVWVTSGDRGRIAVYDAERAEPLLFLPAGSPPQHVAFGAGVAFVTSGHDGTLTVHRLRDGKTLRATRVPVGSYNVERVGDRVLTPSLSLGTLCLVTARGGIQHRVRVASTAHDACAVFVA